MEALKKFYEQIAQIDFTVRAQLAAGALWAIFAAVLGVYLQLQLATVADSPSPALDYGYVRPAFTTVLIFGALLSFFLAGAYDAIRRITGGQLALAPAAAAGFFVQQSAVILGVVTIWLGFNKGRELGEMTWISDNLLTVGLLLYVVTIVHAQKASGKTDWSGALFTLTGAGAIAIFLTGNIMLPYGVFYSASFWTGMQDATAGEVYRIGVLSYFIALPSIALLHHYLPSYYNVPLYSEGVARFTVIALAVLVPLAGPAGLVFTAAPQLLATIGVAAAVALGFATLGGIWNASSSLSRGPRRVRSDAFGLAMRTGVFFFAAAIIIRILMSLRFMQDIAGYTVLDSRDVSVDAFTYGMLIMLGAGLIALQRSTNRNMGKRGMGWFVGLAMTGAALIYIGNIAHGFAMGYEQSLMKDGELVVTEWTQVIAADSFLMQDADPALKHLLSYAGLHMIGYVLMGLAIILASLRGLLHLLQSSGGPYEAPNLHAGDRAEEAEAAAHGAH